MIRDLFIALAVLILTVTATAWLNSGPRLSVSRLRQAWLGEGGAATTIPPSLEERRLGRNEPRHPS